MKALQKFSLFGAAAALAACSSTAIPTLTPGVSQNAGGTYSVVQDGATITLANGPSVTGNGFSVWGGAGGDSHKAYVFENADVLAIGGMDVVTFETIAGISGTPSAGVPVIGAASYVGGYSGTYYKDGGVAGEAWNVRGSFTTDVDFAARTFSGTGTGASNSSLTVNGTVSGVSISGTAVFAADDYSGAASAPLSGGFYGAGAATLASVYQGDAVAGVIWGQ